MLLVKAAGERFVVACETADAVPDGALDAIRGVAGRAFVAGWTQTGSSANFGWAATAFESRKQKAESRNAGRRTPPTAAKLATRLLHRLGRTRHRRRRNGHDQLHLRIHLEN